MSDCRCDHPTKPVYKSKVNWLVNLPLFFMAILASLPGAMEDPNVAANNPLGAGKTKMILWVVAILNFYFRNFSKQTTLTMGNTAATSTNADQPLTNRPADVILNSDDVQSPNIGYRISNEISKEAGGTNG
jgi:hypothetical protein